MSILSVIAISFVVFGHFNFPQIDSQAVGTIFGWFPYYSFHLPLFLFISGYFFRDFSEEAGFFRSFGKFLLKKIRTLIIPFYIINGIFLLSGTFFSGIGITYLHPFKLQEWLVYPWTKLYIITFSVPTWYMIALFVAEIYFVFIRQGMKLVIRNEKAREIAILAVTLGLGILAISLERNIHVPETLRVYLRSVVMLFFIQTGVMYRKYLEKADRLPSIPYIFLILLIQFLIIVLSDNGSLSPGLYGLLDFGPAGYDYFLAGITGVALWLRISRILAAGTGGSRFITFVGNNTKYIMAFHVFGFFLLNSIFCALKNNGAGLTFLKDFSIRIFRSYLYYVYRENPRLLLLYYLAGMGFSLLAAWIISIVKRQIKKTSAGMKSKTC